MRRSKPSGSSPEKSSFLTVGVSSPRFGIPPQASSQEPRSTHGPTPPRQASGSFHRWSYLQAARLGADSRTATASIASIASRLAASTSDQLAARSPRRRDSSMRAPTRSRSLSVSASSRPQRTYSSQRCARSARRWDAIAVVCSPSAARKCASAQSSCSIACSRSFPRSESTDAT